MSLVKTITKPGGSRPLGWVVATPTWGNVLVVRRTPKAFAITTKRSQYVSINDSADHDQAGWSLDDPLYRAIKAHDCKQVVVFLPRPGIVYMTDAANYSTPGVAYLVPKNKSGDRIRCVGANHFTHRNFKVRI